MVEIFESLGVIRLLEGFCQNVLDQRLGAVQARDVSEGQLHEDALRECNVA